MTVSTAWRARVREVLAEALRTEAASQASQEALKRNIHAAVREIRGTSDDHDRSSYPIRRRRLLAEIQRLQDYLDLDKEVRLLVAAAGCDSIFGLNVEQLEVVCDCLASHLEGAEVAASDPNAALAS